MDRPAWVTNEAEWQADCAAIVKCAHDLVEGRTGVIECSRTMQRLAFKVRDEWNPDFVDFRGIDSESQELPLGEQRKYWEPSALEREDTKADSYEERCREIAFSSAKRLIDKYS